MLAVTLLYMFYTNICCFLFERNNHNFNFYSSVWPQISIFHSSFPVEHKILTIRPHFGLFSWRGDFHSTCTEKKPYFNITFGIFCFCCLLKLWQSNHNKLWAICGQFSTAYEQNEQNWSYFYFWCKFKLLTQNLKLIYIRCFHIQLHILMAFTNKYIKQKNSFCIAKFQNLGANDGGTKTSRGISFHHFALNEPLSITFCLWLSAPWVGEK